MQMITDMRAFIGGVVKGGKIVLVLLKIIIIIHDKDAEIVMFFFYLEVGKHGRGSGEA